MTLRDEFNAVTDVIAPELGIGRVALKALLVVALLAAAGAAFWWVFLSGGQAKLEQAKTQARATGLVGDAQSAAGAHAVQQVAGQAAKETIITNTTRTNTIEITRQPGAGDPVTDAVDTAGRHAVCLRASGTGLPDCQRLQEASP